MSNLRYIITFFLLCNLNTIAQEHKKDEQNLLSQMTKAIEIAKYGGVHSILIAKGNQLDYEHYFNGFNQDSLHDSRSSFKSVTSLLIGIAIDKGLIKNVNQKVSDFFPENTAFKNDVYKKNMTIKNLLEMKSGFDCEEFNDTKDCEEEMSSSQNWVEYSLNIPMKTQPGKLWSYTSVDPVILSGVIKKAAGTSIMDFAKKYLFDPLGISKYRWTVDPSGNGMTGGSFYILPRDMVKIGQMVKNKGTWNNKQVVSKKWISESTLCDIAIPDFSFMKSSRSKSGIPQPAYYGYYWYRELLKTADFEQNLLFASGNGGQYIFIIKDLDLTVVFTQGNYQSFKSKQAFEILADYIVPAYRKQQH